MAAKKGDGLLMVYCDVAAEHDDEFNRWYNEEHIPERLAIPGVLNAARYRAVEGGPTYLACYELASPDAWHTDVWQERLKPEQLEDARKLWESKGPRDYELTYVIRRGTEAEPERYVVRVRPGLE